MNSKCILVVPDLINGPSSGALSARATVSMLTALKFTVGVYSHDVDGSQIELSAEKLLYFKQRQNAWHSFLFDYYLTREFVHVIKTLKPDYVFFIGGKKPSILARAARKCGVKTVFLFYINDYYCVKYYAGLETGSCYQCIGNNGLSALKNGCIKPPLAWLRYIKVWLVHRQLQYDLAKSHRVVGYTPNQLSLYQKCGIDAKQCAQISFQFDPSELVHIPIEDQGYFLILGQPRIEKGWHLLAEVFSKCTSPLKIKMIFSTEKVAQQLLEDYGLLPFVRSGMIECLYDVRERHDLLSIVGAARAVIIPTYYPTTGEFVLLESLLLSKPVVVFDVGAHIDMIQHGVNGMVADEGDVSAMAAHIDEVNVNSNVRQSLSKGAKFWADHFFSQNAMLTSLANLFSQ